MDSEPLAGPATVDRAVHRPGAAAAHALHVGGPAEDALGPGVAGDHQGGIVGGVLGQRLHRDDVAGRDLDLRRQGAAEEPPVHARGIDGEVVARRPVLLRPCAGPTVGEVDRLGSDGAFPLPPGRGRILRPATLPSRAGDGGQAFRLLLPEVARRHPEPRPEHPAEMGGVVETAAEGDLGHGQRRLSGAGEIGSRALQSPLADVVAETVAGALEEFLQVALRDAFGLRHARRRELGIVEPAFDRPAEPCDEGLGAGASGLSGGRRRRERGGEKQLGHAQLHGGPVGFRHLVQDFTGAAQRRGEDGAKAIGRDDTRALVVTQSGPPSAQRAGVDRQGDDAQALRKGELPAPAARQHDERAGVRARGTVLRAQDGVVLQQQQHREIGHGVIGEQRLLAGDQSRDEEVVGCAPQRSHRGRGLQPLPADRAEAKCCENLLPGHEAVILDIGLAGEVLQAHGGLDADARLEATRMPAVVGPRRSQVHVKTLLRMDPCTPQLASTTWVTPKSAATDMRAMASSSLSLWTVIRKRRSLRKASRIALSRLA